MAVRLVCSCHHALFTAQVSAAVSLMDRQKTLRFREKQKLNWVTQVQVSETARVWDWGWGRSQVDACSSDPCPAHSIQPSPPSVFPWALCSAQRRGPCSSGVGSHTNLIIWAASPTQRTQLGVKCAPHPTTKCSQINKYFKTSVLGAAVDAEDVILPCSHEAAIPVEG